MENKEKKAREKRLIFRSLAMITELALSAICPIILLLLAGIWLDGKYGNGGYWFTAAGIICGIYSAYRGVYYLIKDFTVDKKEKNGKVHSEDDI